MRSMRPCVAAISALVLILLLALPATAHVPVLPGDHNSLATAMRIKDPAVSYAIYGTLHEGGEADYFTVVMRKGDLLTFSVSTPARGSYAPWLVIAGPGLTLQGTVPVGIEHGTVAVLDGKGQMPPWRGVLGETELDQLWAYIRANAN